jgi:hypothetical protein
VLNQTYVSKCQVSIWISTENLTRKAVIIYQYFYLPVILSPAPDCSPTLQSTQALTSTSIRVTWAALPNTKCRNGILRGYKVLYRKSSGGSTVTSNIDNPNTLSKDLNFLEKYTRYRFQVLGFTVKDGPLSNAMEKTTQQDGKLWRQHVKLYTDMKYGDQFE